MVVGDSVFRELANIKVANTLMRELQMLANNLQKHMLLIENTFGLLKEKFRRLENYQQNEESTKHMKIIITCSVFRNLIINN